MTDCEYFERQLDAAYAEYEQWQTLQRGARSPERIEYCQAQIAAAQRRLARIEEMLSRIKRGGREG